MAKIIHIEKHHDLIVACEETKTLYRFFSIDKNDKIETLETFRKTEFKSFEHFWNVVGKFNPYTVFLKEPVESELKFVELKQIKGGL